MDSKAIKRAALMTLRRAIFERFPPGPTRRAWLRWAERLERSERPDRVWRDAWRAATLR
jgi:hypothetical protein